MTMEGKEGGKVGGLACGIAVRLQKEIVRLSRWTFLRAPAGSTSTEIAAYASWAVLL